MSHQNAWGEWVPAIPLPFMFWLGVPYTECHCGKRFIGRIRGRALRRYEEHYAPHARAELNMLQAYRRNPVVAGVRRPGKRGA
jgi:hypothetical protein